MEQTQSTLYHYKESGYNSCQKRNKSILSSTDRQAIVGRLTPDYQAQPSVYIMMYISLKSRPTVGRSSGDHRPTPDR